MALYIYLIRMDYKGYPLRRSYLQGIKRVVMEPSLVERDEYGLNKFVRG